MFTRSGTWTFFRVYDVISERLNARERAVYNEIAWRCVRKTQNILTKWAGSDFALPEGSLVIKTRELARALDLSHGSLVRTLRALEFKRVLQTLRRSRGAGGGLIVRLTHPDEISDCATRRALRLEHLLTELESRNDWKKDPKCIARWNNLKQELKQLRDRLTRQLDLGIQKLSTSRETISGTVDVPIHRNVFRESAQAFAAFDERVRAMHAKNGLNGGG